MNRLLIGLALLLVSGQPFALGGRAGDMVPVPNVIDWPVATADAYLESLGLDLRIWQSAADGGPRDYNPGESDRIIKGQVEPPPPTMEAGVGNYVSVILHVPPERRPMWTDLALVFLLAAMTLIALGIYRKI